MSEGFNRAMLLGQLGADPDLRYASGGGAVMNLRLATTERIPPRDGVGEWQERTEWHRVVVFGKRAEGLAKVLAKGSTLLVEGSIRTSSYEKDGAKRFSTGIVAQRVVITGSRGQGRPTTTEAAPREQAQQPFDEGDDGIPF